MKGYIPKQPKQIKERIEAKLDARLIRTLESYCKYLDSDRDYIIAQALEIAFKKDRAFSDWLSGQPATASPEVSGRVTAPLRKRSRKPGRGADSIETNATNSSVPGTSMLASQPISKGA